jgi:hypothetical protein
MREIAPMVTICMHGSPLSRWERRLLLQKYNYHDFGITGEPYFDVDFLQVLYLTDTGRRWDGEKVSLRDRAFVKTSAKEIIKFQGSFRFHSTSDIIAMAAKAGLPDKVMITVHPQRWSNNLWTSKKCMKYELNRILLYIIAI